MAYDSPRRRAHLSLTTSASGVADSTISYNTYATGITEGSLNLSQFPPPPATLPSTPVVERFLPSPSSQHTFTDPSPRAYPGVDQRQPSPARSTFTITASAYSGVYQGQPSPSWSTFTVSARAQNQASRTASPTTQSCRSGPVLDRGLPSPALSTFTITAPLHPAADAQPILFPSSHEFSDDGCCSSRGHGKPQTFDPRAESQSPTPLLDGKLSPYDWHEGSSILSVDPAEERMLSTSLITDLLSSNTPDKTPSPGDSLPQRLHPLSSQADVSNLASEISYPPSLRQNEAVAGSGRSPPTSHPVTAPGEGLYPRIDRENVTMASYSHEEHPNTVGTAQHLTRGDSVVGIAPPTLRHMASETSVSESTHPRSQATYGSSAPLNPYPPPAFSSAMNRLQTADIQPPMGVPQGWTPERPVSPDFSSGKKPVKPQRRASAHSSRTVRTHVSSLISSVGQRTARAARATMGWMRVKPLPPIPTIPHTSIYHEQEHRRMEGAVPLPQLADRADRLVVMLDSGHLPHNSIIRPISRFSSDKASLTSPQRLQDANFGKSPPGGTQSPWKFKLFPKLTIDQTGKVKLFIGASVLALLVLVGIIVGIVVGRKHGHSVSCSANRTGNTCSLGEYSAPWLES